LLTPFETWRRFDERRRSQAQSVLTTLRDSSALSRNARDIVERMLADG
jgi:hypothetical protein